MKKLTITLGILFAFYNLFAQNEQVENDSLEKSLVVIGLKQYMWTKTEMQDSVNWSNVKRIKLLTPSEAVLEYGKSGANGAAVVIYKPKEFKLPNQKTYELND